MRIFYAYPGSGGDRDPSLGPAEFILNVMVFINLTLGDLVAASEIIFSYLKPGRSEEK